MSGKEPYPMAIKAEDIVSVNYLKDTSQRFDVETISHDSHLGNRFLKPVASGEIP
ncbi:MAG: hypothetical protein SCJ97_01170 [Bacillota bacterium]|nr:hypothetical protein [Bacillota bacterium]